MASVATLDGTEWEELRDATWIVDGAINADYNSPLINCIGWERLQIFLSIASTSDPVGVLYVRSGGSSTAAQCGLAPIDEISQTDTTAITHTAGARNIVVNDPAATAYITIERANLMDYAGLFYDATSGGSATGLNAGYTLRRRRFR